MKLLHRPMTITNTDGAYWQVSLPSITFSEDRLENIDITVLVRRSDAALPDLQLLAVRRAVELLQGYLDAAPSSQPGSAAKST